jgi:hypothetical protein
MCYHFWKFCLAARGFLVMVLRVIAGVLLLIWLLLVLMGKGGFVHILLLNGLGVAAVAIMTSIRTRMTVRN